MSLIHVLFSFFFLMIRRPPRSTRTDTLFPYTTLFRSLLYAAIFIGSSPASRVITGGCGIARGGRPSTAFRIAAIWPGVEPQQPPRMFTCPCSAHSLTSHAVCSGISYYCTSQLRSDEGSGGEECVSTVR